MAVLGAEVTDSERKLFYAHEDAKYYDITVEFAAPHYRMMHDMVLDLILLRLNERGESADAHIMDVGSGTGVSTLSILQASGVSTVLAVDSSPTMNHLLRRKVERVLGTQGNERLAIFEVDVRDAAFNTTSVRQHANANAEGFTAVATVLTLHHFTEAEKFKIYETAFEALEPGGVLVNGDFFGFCDEDRSRAWGLGRRADEVTLSWIENGFDDERAFASTILAGRAERMRLKSEWIRHVQEEHHLTSSRSHVEQLTEIGFAHVEFPFRYWQSGVLWARKEG